MSMIVRIRASIAALSCVCAAGTVGAEAWPGVQTPPGSHVQSVADDMVLNGKRSRLYRFEFNGTEKEVLHFYRAQFGPKRVENQIKGTHVVATQQGDYFHTVQLRRAGSHRVEVIIMTTELRVEGQSNVWSIDARALMPPATALLSTLQSQDGAKRSMLILGANGNSIRANRDHLVSALQARGLRIRSEEAGTAAGYPSIVLILASADEQVDLTISDSGAFRSLVINQTWERK